MATWFVGKETENVKVVENFDEIEPDLAVDYWEGINSDSPIGVL